MAPLATDAFMALHWHFLWCYFLGRRIGGGSSPLKQEIILANVSHPLPWIVGSWKGLWLQFEHQLRQVKQVEWVRWLGKNTFWCLRWQDKCCPPNWWCASFCPHSRLKEEDGMEEWRKALTSNLLGASSLLTAFHPMLPFPIEGAKQHWQQMDRYRWMPLINLLPGASTRWILGCRGCSNGCTTDCLLACCLLNFHICQETRITKLQRRFHTSKGKWCCKTVLRFSTDVSLGKYGAWNNLKFLV